MLMKCTFEIDILVDVDGKTVAQVEEFAARYLRDECDHAEAISVEAVTGQNLPKVWEDSLPYRDPDVGPELTCRQILSAATKGPER